MNPETLPGGGAARAKTRRRAAVPSVTDPRVLLLLTVALAVLIAARQFL